MSELNRDEDWLIRLSEGSNEAYERLFSTYWPKIYTLVKMLVKSAVQAEDLTQEIFIKLWDRRSELHEVNNLEAYLYRIARNASLDFLKKRVLVTENLENLIGFLKDDSLGPEQRLVYKDLEAFLEEGINALPSTIREVFILSRYQQLSHAEIAQQLGISIHSSKAYVVRALQALRLHMRKHSQVKYVILAAWLINQLGQELS